MNPKLKDDIHSALDTLAIVLITNALAFLALAWITGP